MRDARPLAVSLGEPGGVGPDLAVMAWRDHKNGADLPDFIIVGDADTLAARAKMLGESPPIAIVGEGKPENTTPPEHKLGDGLGVWHCPLGAEAKVGVAQVETGGGVVDSLETALALATAKTARGLVTLPIHKEALLKSGFRWAGHTGWLEARCNCKALMLFVSGDLRVALLTIHIPLAEVAANVTEAAVVSACERLARGLADDFGISAARIAVAGLNPHAGEGGALGREEIDIIAPALESLRARGVAASGPFPADTLFHEDARAQYDAVLAMYHDQALIGLKTADFWGATQMSLGLPIVRTSPDHGTALDIAGGGTARPESFYASLRLADALAARRARGEGAR
ncbi:MAG: 4-hydroxythreonine-4-phosphate dehydrogenase PdxA [Alphaproteobacteria bacterium]|nr:4-hydroxythreonine-4-phosphate dehydrogenase PdxA [Alphaproteobacteria bacterium]